MDTAGEIAGIVFAHRLQLLRHGGQVAVVPDSVGPADSEAAVHSAVRDGKLWLTSGPASILAEEIPAGLLTNDARLQAPPQPIPTTEVLLPQVAERLVAKPGVCVAEADLRPNEIQDPADQVADIAKAAVGLDLKFRLRVELGGGSRPSDEVVASINQLL